MEGRRGRGSAPDLCPLFPSSLCPGAEEAGCPLTTGPQKIQFLLSAHPLRLSPCFPCLDLTWNWLKTTQECIFPTPYVTWKIPRGVASPAPRPHPYWLLIGWGSPHPLFPLVPPLCHPLGAGSSAGDVPSNPTVRGREGGNFTFPCCRFTLTLNAFEVLFFKKKKSIYIYI